MSSKNNNNKLNIPEARDAMNQFKMEAANEVGVDLKKGYNGNLTSRELRPEPCGGAGPPARKGVHASTLARALPRRPRGRVPKPAAGRAPRWLPRGRVRASAGGR